MQQEAAIAFEGGSLFHTLHCKKECHDLDINVQACFRFYAKGL